MPGNPKFWARKKSKIVTPTSSQLSLKVAESSKTALHGYYGFKIYFVNDIEIDLTSTLQCISAFEQHIQSHDTQYSLPTIRKNKMFFVDLTFLESDDKFIIQWSTFKKDIISNTEYCLACMGLAMHQAIIMEEKNTLDTERFESLCIPRINARVTNHQPILHLKNLKVNYFSNLVSIRGTVIRASNIRLLCKYMAFACSSCSEIQVINQIDGTYTIPAKCPTKGCRAQSNFIPLFNAPGTRTVNWQTLKLQEVIGIEQGENGRVPRTVECELTDDLVGCCIPGDDITVTGIIKVRNNTDVGHKKNQPSIFLLYIDSVSVTNNKNQTQVAGGGVDRITFNTNDYYAIQKIHAEPSLFRFLTHSLCPNIYGNEVIKAGLLLTLFGGTRTSQGDIATRSVSHALMVGDPGLGKSQMLQACTNVTPRGVYVCGNTSTSSGLTITMTKESSGDYSLEAGALILANQGTCCIDEFDKMTNQHAHLLEAMEQQSVSIAKAGITCNLAACTSVLAAANPSGGHYNKGKTISENLKLSSPLISRFDLVFVLLDRPCENQDLLLSEHILALHSGLQKQLNPVTYGATMGSSGLPTTLKERLKLKPGEKIDFLPHILLRKYVAYAQKYVNPTLSKEAQSVLKDFYLKLRKTRQGSNCMPITARQLESLLRLTQARAKVELREEATADDAMDVVEIMQHSFIDIFSDEYGTLDFGRSQNGSGISNRNKIKKLLLLLQEQAERLSKSTFSLEELKIAVEQASIPKEQFGDVLGKLNLHGYLLKRSPHKYQLASVELV